MLPIFRSRGSILNRFNRMRSVCECESHGCQARGGVQLDTRTIQNHRRKDQLLMFENAKAASERAVQEELDRVSQHLAETTLGDTPVQNTRAAADNLCRQLSDLTLDSKSASSTTQDRSYSEIPSRNSAVRQVLARLNEIEAATAGLQHKITSAADDLQGTHSTNAHFALDHLLRDCYSLQADLNKVILKAAPVTAMKEEISGHLTKIRVQLEAQKSEWHKRHKEHKPSATVAYPTSMIVYWISLLV
jgi:hypothetical protein